MNVYPLSLLLLFILVWKLQVSSSRDITPCGLRVYMSKAEQQDENGLKCWDHVEVPSCGGRCDSREISDWQFPFKKSYHPVCAFGARRALMVRLQHCDPGVTPGTEDFHFVAAVDCKCRVCSSKYTSCEWLPPNSTLLRGITDSDSDE